MRVCSICGDVVLYCKCMYENSYELSQLTSNPSFWIKRGDQLAIWESETRGLYGNPTLLSEIRSYLHGKEEMPLFGMADLWMTDRDPNAVYFVARFKIKGCRFSKSAPDWREMTRTDVIY